MTSWAKALKRAFFSPAPYLSWAALTAFFAVSAPFGTYVRFPLPQRAIYFGILIGVCIAWGVAARALVQARFAAMGFAAASVTVAAVSAAILPYPILRFTVFMSGPNGPNPPTLAHLAGIVFTIAIIVATMRWALTYGFGADASVAQSHAGHDHDTVPGDTAGADAADDCSAALRKFPRLYARLPDGMTGRLIRLTARDHYVDVVTEGGQAALLLRLSDAIAEMDGVDGLRVHRSHWVASDAVVGYERAGGKRMLVLRDGARVPVSRALQPEVAARGLI